MDNLIIAAIMPLPLTRFIENSVIYCKRLNKVLIVCDKNGGCKAQDDVLLEIELKDCVQFFALFHDKNIDTVMSGYSVAYTASYPLSRATHCIPVDIGNYKFLSILFSAFNGKYIEMVGSGNSGSFSVEEPLVLKQSQSDLIDIAEDFEIDLQSESFLIDLYIKVIADQVSKIRKTYEKI